MHVEWVFAWSTLLLWKLSPFLFWDFQFYTTCILSCWDNNKGWQVAWSSYQWCVRNRACYAAMVKHKISVLLLIIFCSWVTETTLLCENGGSVPRAGRGWFEILNWSKEQWSNNKTIILELGYCKIMWFVSFSPSALANKLICSPLTNHNIMLNHAQ